MSDELDGLLDLLEAVASKHQRALGPAIGGVVRRSADEQHAILNNRSVDDLLALCSEIDALAGYNPTAAVITEIHRPSVDSPLSEQMARTAAVLTGQSPPEEVAEEDEAQLEDMLCYVGTLQRAAAEVLLHDKPVGTFVVRQSVDGSYVFSVRSPDAKLFRHIKIEHPAKNVFKIAEKESHSSLMTLIQHYSLPNEFNSVVIFGDAEHRLLPFAFL